MWTCAIVIALAACAGAITRDQFYPYGPGLDQRLPRGEIPSPEVPLAVPIVFYGQTYETVFVNNYGVLSFRADISTFLNFKFPLPYPSIAAFYTNVDTTAGGAVYYRETNESHVLSKAEESVQSNFAQYYDFKPTSVFIATWIDVTYIERSDRKNSFQIAVISNGTESFVELLYPEKKIQWIQRDAKLNSLPDAKAQAGFVAEDGRMFNLRGSGSHQIRNIVTWSNVHQPGKYVFRVGNISDDGNIAVPDQYDQYEVEVEEESKTCAQSGPSVCHMQARCVDYQAGICCQCNQGFYGNGKSCIKNDVPLRVHGKLNGIINDVPLNDVDIQAYVVVADGRSYTALSQGPHSIGSSLQLLSVLGGVIGWLFAKPSGTAKNGYQLTGALFNHTADIVFPATGDRVTINQEFLGHDVFDQITLESDIRGTVPVILTGTKLEVTEYDEQYTVVDSGVIRSDSVRTFTNKITGEKYEQRISQTFTFNPCRYAPLSEEDAIPSNLKVAKNYLGYETKENIVRYGLSNKITQLGQEDPCIKGRSTCGPHSNCVVQGDSFTCVCQSGFVDIFLNDAKACVDVDECTAGIHKCDTNADCYNHDGGYQCRCKSGFEGNGESCKRVSPCREQCDPNAQCIVNVLRLHEPTCICIPGYTGDGLTCWPATNYGCDNCSPNAHCGYGDDNSYKCICNDGFTGDGSYCEEISHTPTEQDPSAQYPSQYPSVQYPNEQDPSAQYPAQYPNGQDPSAQYPAQYPNGQDPSAQYPAQYPNGQDPSAQYPAQYPNGQDPSTRYPAQYPSRHDPSAQYPSQYRPQQPNGQDSSGQNPTEQDLSAQYPAQYPSSQNPPGQDPYTQYPSAQYPSQHYPSPHTPSQYTPDQYNPTPNTPEQYTTTSRPAPVTTPYYLPPQTTNEAEYNETFVLPNCDVYGCVCPSGYSSYKDERDNDLCRIDSYRPPNQLNEYNNDTSIRCEADSDCPPNGICSFPENDPFGTGHCVCPEGYEGDMYECIERTGPSCSCGNNAHCVETAPMELLCVCDSGYQGDGYVCRPNFSCKNDSDCEYHAVCRANAATNEYVCECIEGYIKDQNDACIPDKQLCNGAVCAEHASCLYDSTDDVSYCHCDPGYEGSGIDQCIAQGTTCDVKNDCHPDALCTPTDSSYQCVCREGYVGDGYSCRLEATCLNDPYMCDLHASCLKRSGGYVCECNTGYSGNGSYCALNPRQAGNFLIASDGTTVYKVSFGGSPRDYGTPINSAVYQIAVGVDVDCETGRIYWGDVVSNTIKRCAYDGSGLESFLTSDVKAPEGLAIDWSSRNIFWTDSKKLTIEVANMATRIRKVLFEKDGISNPRGIAVHPQRGKIFWSDWNRVAPKIEWANMDGTQRGVFVDQSDVKLPNSLAIDWSRDRLCYADAGLNSIKCVGIDSLDKETIASQCSHPFGLAINDNKFYWTDWKTLKIEYIDAQTKRRGEVSIATASRRLYGVAVAPDQCPASGNVCQFRNGNCEPDQLCLPDGRGGRTCVTGISYDNY